MPPPVRFARLDQWLEWQQSAHPVAIDLGLERVARVLRRTGWGGFRQPVITVGGTNGKGSCVALLDAMLRAGGFRVGTFTSPHLVDYRERIRIDGEWVSEASLVAAFERIADARCDDSLTFFEFNTLAALLVFETAGPDAIVLEVGLGGRLDAVNVVDADVAVVVSVGLDHMEYLGTDRESIGLEKAHVMRPGKPAIVSDPLPPASVVAHAAAIGADLWLVGRDFSHRGDRQQWAWSGRGRRYHALSYPALRGANQLLNASGAIAALEALRERLPITAQAVRNGLAMVELPGRFQIVPGQPALVLDVAHNPQAVAALAVNLDAMGFFPRTHAVFGAMRDKDIPALLAKMVPLVDAWHCCDLPTPRAATAAALAQQVHAAVAGGGGAPVAVHTHASPIDALRHVTACADPADRIVVFGSFFTVGGVLKEGLPRLSAPHLG
jgi:dihydrofolate synthase/folylpolyglutamate synthase